MQKMFKAMEELLSTAPMAYFTHYREDFEVHDRRELLQWGDAAMSYLWIVRESGTHLVPLGVHPSLDNHGQAVLDIIAATPPSRARVFWLADERVIEVSRAVALERLHRAKPRYQVRYGSVLVNGDGQPEKFASICIETEARSTAMPLRHVRIRARRKLHAAEVSVLRLIAQCEVATFAGSLLVAPASITIDGVDIADAMVNARRTVTEAVEA